MNNSTSQAVTAPPPTSLPIFHTAIGSQSPLPFKTALRISVQGIRIRLGRSLVTVSGVVLGIAFLMSNLTGQLIKNSVTAQRETRQQSSLMAALVRAEIGEVRDKKLAVAAFGSLGAAETELLHSLVAARPASFRGFGVQMAGITPTAAKSLGEGACLLIVLGSAAAAPESLADLTQGMAQKVVIDTESGRTFTSADPSARREFFFGAQLDQQKARMEKETRQARSRTLWIVIISLLVTVIGVSNALLMSVTERFREIGTMKCLGALSSFIRVLFLIESSLIGAAGSILGVVVGAILPIIAYGFTYTFATVLGSMSYGALAMTGLASAIVGTLLAIMAAIYPAAIAARMVPAAALRSTV